MEKWYILWQLPEKTQSKLWIPGDTIYVSNKGRVKLNEEILSLGHGLWMDIEGNINIVGRSYGKYNNIYRFIYTMDIDPTFNGGHQWQIHHKDRNHSNNNSNNLIKLTAKEHLQVHSTDQFDNELLDRLNNLKKYYKEQSDKKFEHIATFKEWLRNRYTKYYNDIVLPQKELQRKEREHQLEKQKQETKLLKDERKQQKLIEQQKLIDAGTHFRCKDGRLMSYKQIDNMNKSKKNRDKSYITDEWKQKMKQIQQKLHNEGICTGRASTEEKEKLRKEKISKSMMGKKNAVKNKKSVK